LPISSVISNARLVAARDDRLVGPPQYLAALTRRVRGPLGLRVGGAASAARASCGCASGDLHERLAGGRVLDAQRAAAGRVAPLSADQQLLGNAVEHRLALA